MAYKKLRHYILWPSQLGANYYLSQYGLLLTLVLYTCDLVLILMLINISLISIRCFRKGNEIVFSFSYCFISLRYFFEHYFTTHYQQELYHLSILFLFKSLLLISIFYENKILKKDLLKLETWFTLYWH